MKYPCIIGRLFVRFPRVVLLMVAILAGCEGDLDIVKSGTLPANKTTTVGAALDNWKSCRRGEWSFFTTDNGMRVVEFVCEAKITSEFEALAKMGLEKKLFDDPEKKASYLEAIQIQAVEYVLYFTINTDDTFQVDSVHERVVWHDGKHFSRALNRVQMLKSIYLNEEEVAADVGPDVEFGKIPLSAHMATQWRLQAN